MTHRKLRPSRTSSSRRDYRPPTDIGHAALSELLRTSCRAQLEEKQLELLRNGDLVELYFAGDLSLVDRPCVAIVGSRAVSLQGRFRSERLARELAASGFVVVSGLGLGVDTAAHTAALAAGGNTIAVIGTPLDRAYPAENATLQERIYADHLLVSPFRVGERTYRSNFPKRNCVMAALSDATVIIEASDTSGSLHQAAECVRLSRWLFIAKSLAENRDLDWPKKFLKRPRTAVLSATSDLLGTVTRERRRQKINAHAAGQ
jgi:DNA protecting protein DprA